MPFDTNWSIDDYKTEHESDEHWQLRRTFMEQHKDKFPEDELVCLAQVFVNVEFLGCKYPDTTMQKVALLSEEVAREYRKERATRLKRTFVKASDAASAKAKGTVAKKEVPISVQDDTEEEEQRTGFGGKSKTVQQKGISWPNEKTPLQKKYKTENDLMTGLAYGPFIMYMLGGRNALTISAARSGIKVLEKESVEGSERKVEIFIGGKLAGVGKAPGIKPAKTEAFDAAVKKIQEECYVITPNPEPHRITIKKDEKTLKCSFKPVTLPEIDSNNIGFKMMQKFGWTGGALGVNNKRTDNAFDVLVRNNRRGLGDNSDQLDTEYFKKMLTQYIKSDDITDLTFEAGFTKEERATLHKLAMEVNLKSSSYGKFPNRYLVISKKNIQSKKILYEVLVNKNPMYINKFDVTVPIRKYDDFPEHKAFQ